MPFARALIRILLILPLTRRNTKSSYTHPQLSGPIHPLSKFLRYLFVLFGCLHLVGGPYSLMQACAWVNMIVDYSKETGFAQAVTDTFSGEKPCCLCKRIAAAKATESKSDQKNAPLSPLGSKSIEHLFPPFAISLRAPHYSPFLHSGFMPVAQSISWLASGPPSPPPEC